MTTEELRIEEGLTRLRQKWAAYKKKGDVTMCGVIEAQARMLEKGKKKEDLYDQAKEIFK